ncbi:type III pantothenate kinase [Flavobacteriaceae bacterium R38]|nr:type III pantothenate kinase [Flavobacteriaceae bacterium R38]
MNLVVDVGNTQIKLAVFEKDRLLLDKRILVHDFLKEIDEIKIRFTEIKRGIVSSVGNLPDNYLHFLQENYQIHILTNNSKIPFKNKYSTPKTLGVDRIALVSAAVNKYPQRNVLIIDAGSCITYDFINEQKEYLGGAISPGLEMRFKALNHYTAGLPLLKSEDFEGFIGDSTKASMISGIQNGMVYEVEGFIGKYSEKYKDLTVILTGGDLHFLSKRLKNTIFANPKFILGGLNQILEYNKHE